MLGQVTSASGATEPGFGFDPFESIAHDEVGDATGASAPKERGHAASGSKVDTLVTALSGRFETSTKRPSVPAPGSRRPFISTSVDAAPRPRDVDAGAASRVCPGFGADDKSILRGTAAENLRQRPEHILHRDEPGGIDAITTSAEMRNEQVLDIAICRAPGYDHFVQSAR